MAAASLDYRLGFRYACEMLDARAAKPVEVLVAGLPNWAGSTAANLIHSAQVRIAEGVNPEYQRGVIARAEQELAQ
jgi:hypothetical protein